MASFRKPDCTCKNQKKCTCGAEWEYRIRYKDPVTQKFKEKSKRGFKTKKEAQLEAAKVEQEIEDNTFVYKDSMTYQQAYDEWWGPHSKTLKPSTRYTLTIKFKKHILPRFGHMKLKDISKTYCQKMIDEMATQVNSVMDFKIQANQVFKYAEREGYINKNPMASVVIPKKEEDFLAEDEKINFWTKEQINKFLTLAKKEMDRQDFVMFYLLLYTGMRKGELLALEWDDIDFSQQSILIRQTLFFKDKKEVMQKVKTYQARTIHIDEDTLKSLRKWGVQQREWLLGYGITKTPKNVLTREDMRPLRLAYPNDKLKSFIKNHNQSYNEQIDLLKKEIEAVHQSGNTKEVDKLQSFLQKAQNELLPNITVHGFRHTHASILFEAKATLKEVQERLGHKDIQTTMNIYTHVTRGVKEKTADIFNKFLKS